MSTITIPKKLAGRDDLIAVPREEYEELLKWRGVIKTFKTFTPTPAQKTALKRARQNYKSGKHMTLNELKRRLGGKN